VLSRPGITSAILGASKPEHITEAAKTWNERLSSEELAKADDATANIADKVAVTN
jgi:aryl-alcohol dehydrogenase-like predicted oxidoreductase